MGRRTTAEGDILQECPDCGGQGGWYDGQNWYICPECSAQGYVPHEMYCLDGLQEIPETIRE